MKSFFQLAPWLGAATLLAGLFSPAVAAPTVETRSLEARASPDRLVFAHFMIGIVEPRGRGDWDEDMKRAKAAGIDAFALNIGQDKHTDRQLDLAYNSAADNGMKVFISFDFNIWKKDSEAVLMGQKIAQFAKYPAQLRVDGKVFVSTFQGDGLNVRAMRDAVGQPIFFAPNFASWATPSSSELDAAFNWVGWLTNGYNRAPSRGSSLTVEDGDRTYKNWLGGKPYIAPVSPWFSTHYGTEVSYSKNWVMPGDLVWFNRWNEILKSSPPYLEIVSWNDYGESHYIGPLSSKHDDDGNSKWINDMPHDGWLEMAKPFIQAYHDGANSVNNYIKKDQLIYWYRPTLKSLNCDATDTTMGWADNSTGNYYNGRPNGFDSFEDAVFVVSLLTQPGTVTVTSGGNNPITYSAPAGAFAQKIPMGVGQQRFDLSRNGQSVFSGTSLKDISNICPCGLYNWNAYVGMLPFEPFGVLDSTALGMFSKGLKVDCKPSPTLDGRGGAAAPTSNPPTGNPPVDSPPGPAPTNCNGGTVKKGVSENFKGLCEVSCGLNYCPSDVCVCTSTGAPANTPWDKPAGCPLPGLGDGYKGLCSFACGHNYCPPTACTWDNCSTK
ncbi:putative alpha-1,3-glucanase/mutanase [Apodospora peruviana]|uniref:Alpha-1,3-glucanase/mutanase n=1 Tax=Apodospora peruviana TaxID=516989 RepID=A0AAE0I132_9PEZI|nr:putative alpha-1,3-glucanase/mutanase [Apodospora peruviana]